MIVNCSTPQYLKFFTIIFELYSPVPNGQEFKRGESYYYISKYSFIHVHVDGLVQDCSNSSALAMELLQSWTKLSM